MTDVKKIFDENVSPIGFKEWGYNKTLREILDECDNESWLLWILSIVLGIEDKLFIYIKAKCVNVIRYTMRNIDILGVIDAGVMYGEDTITYLQYLEKKEKAREAQEYISHLDMNTIGDEYYTYCIESMASSWIYDTGGYLMYKLAIELMNAATSGSTPYIEIKPLLLTIIKDNTLHLS